MRAASNQQQLNDDGTPRRKYELDEQESGKYVLRATIGFVLANAFILVKNVLFGAETASKPPLVSVAAIRDGADRAGEQEDGKLGEERYGDSSPLDDEPDGNSENSGFVKLLHTTSGSYQVFGDQSVASAVRITSSVPAHGNDNIALYGAVPGRSIALFSSEGGHNGLPHFGGDIGGSSGGAPSGGGIVRYRAGLA